MHSSKLDMRLRSLNLGSGVCFEAMSQRYLIGYLYWSIGRFNKATPPKSHALLGVLGALLVPERSELERLARAAGNLRSC